MAQERYEWDTHHEAWVPANEVRDTLDPTTLEYVNARVVRTVIDGRTQKRVAPKDVLVFDHNIGVTVRVTELATEYDPRARMYAAPKYVLEYDPKQKCWVERQHVLEDEVDACTGDFPERGASRYDDKAVERHRKYPNVQLTTKQEAIV